MNKEKLMRKSKKNWKRKKERKKWLVVIFYQLQNVILRLNVNNYIILFKQSVTVFSIE